MLVLAFDLSHCNRSDSTMVNDPSGNSDLFAIGGPVQGPVQLIANRLTIGGGSCRAFGGANGGGADQTARFAGDGLGLHVSRAAFMISRIENEDVDFSILSHSSAVLRSLLRIGSITRGPVRSGNPTRSRQGGLLLCAHTPLITRTDD
jgi:hypothetical protein